MVTIHDHLLDIEEHVDELVLIFGWDKERVIAAISEFAIFNDPMAYSSPCDVPDD